MVSAFKSARIAKASSSMPINFSKISISFAVFPVAGNKQPKMQAFARINGLLPFQ
jgi:hypothetical protein